jgi:hypothetical protein
LPVSAANCVQPAVRHTREQLFTSFRWGQWSRLALVGLLAAEIHAGGCGLGRLNLPSWQRRHQVPTQITQFPHIDPARILQFALLIVAGVLCALVVGVILLYISSVFRFILFDSVLKKHCSISQGWQRWHRAGRRYFLWMIVFVIAQGLFMGVLIAVPLVIARAMGWFRNVGQQGGRVVLAVIFLAGLFLIFVLAVTIVQMVAKDFLVPVMALEDLDFADGWSRVLAMIRREPGSYALYLLLKMVLAIVAAFVFTILAFFPAFLITVPFVATVLAAHAAGMGWNVVTVSLAIIGGSVLLVVLVYLVALICVPATVFFPAFALHFFAARYPKLDALLNPLPPAPEPPPAVPPPISEPPPITPSPEPIA